jgi:hypothetical protein
MRIVLGRVGLSYPEGYGHPACTSYPSNSFCAPEYEIFGVVQAHLGRDPAMRYSDVVTKVISEGIVDALQGHGKEFQDSLGLLRQLVVTGSESLINAGQEKGSQLILSQTWASITLAHLRQHNLYIAYLGKVPIHLIRLGQVVFRNKPHTLGEVKNVPPLTRDVLVRALCVPQDPALIDVQQIAVQPDDLIFVCNNGFLDDIVSNFGADWAQNLTAFGPDIESASQLLTSLVQPSSFVSRVHQGAAWVLALVE